MHAASDEYPGYRASMGPRRASMPGMEYMPQREDTFREYRRPEMRDDTFTRYLQHPEMRQMNGRDPSYSQYDASQVKYQQQQGGGGYRDDHNNFGGNYTSSASSKPPKAQSKGGQPKYVDNDVSEDDDDEYSRGGSNGAKKSGFGKAGGQNQSTGGGGARQGGWMQNEYDDDRGNMQGTSKKSLGKSMSNGNLQDMQYNGMNGGQGMWRGGESTEGYGRSMSVPKMPPTGKSSNKSQGQLYNGGQGGQGMWMQNDFDDDDNRVNSSGKKSGAKGNKSSQQNGYNGQHGHGGWMSNGGFDEDDDNRMNGSRVSANKVSKGTGNGHNVTSASNGRGDEAWAYAQNSQGPGYNGNMQKPKSAMKQGNAQQRSSSKYDTSDDEEDNDSPIKKGVKWALGLSSNSSRSHSHNGGGHDQYNQKGSKVSSNNRFDNQGYANQGYDDMSRSGSKKSGGSSQGKSGQHYNGHMDDLSPMIMGGAKKSGLKKSKSVDFDEMGYSSAEENWGNFNVSSKGAQYNQSSSAKVGNQQQQVQGASGKAQNKVRQLVAQLLASS